MQIILSVKKACSVVVPQLRSKQRGCDGARKNTTRTLLLCSC